MMKKVILILFLFTNSLLAHDMNYEHSIPRHWEVKNVSKDIQGFFYAFKNNEVFIEKENSDIVHFPLSDFSAKDQAFIAEKNAKIEALNKQIANNQQVSDSLPYTTLILKSSLYVLLLLAFGKWISRYNDKKTMRFIYPILALGGLFSLYSFTKKVVIGTDPLVMDAAFKPFKPNVYTRWDNTYFYVESKGIPTTHNMMTGITGWQQQVPIPQCYTGTNAWSIPLNPVVAATPVPVNQQHFLRGAIAIATNGIAIFNPYTNTGVDAFLDGQLDNWGGHCGRADDYHYHTAPLHLYGTSAANLPIAYGLDGYAVYGSKEPDGTAMKTLDANHGHYGTDGVYHYHGTAAAPYMIGNMVGKVTEDATMQIIPQAAAKPIRPAGTPLKGATITSCLSNATNNGYSLTYTLSGQNYQWDYSWDSAGKFTFNFISPVGTSTSVYNGGKPCTLPTATHEATLNENLVSIFPNPNNGTLNLQLNNELPTTDIQSINIYDLKGSLIYKTTTFVEKIDLRNVERGVYLVKIRCKEGFLVKKVVVGN